MISRSGADASHSSVSRCRGRFGRRPPPQACRRRRLRIDGVSRLSEEHSGRSPEFFASRKDLNRIQGSSTAAMSCNDGW